MDGGTSFIIGTPFTNAQSSQFSTTLNVGIDQPKAQAILSVYPNPFTKNATISFGMASAAKAKIQVLNLLGQPVIEVPESFYQAGNHEVIFEAADLRPGIYQVVLRTGSQVFTSKVSLIR